MPHLLFNDPWQWSNLLTALVRCVLILAAIIGLYVVPKLYFQNPRTWKKELLKGKGKEIVIPEAYVNLVLVVGTLLVCFLLYMLFYFKFHLTVELSIIAAVVITIVLGIGVLFVGLYACRDQD